MKTPRSKGLFATGIVLLACAPLFVAAACLITDRLPRLYAASTLIKARFYEPENEISGPYGSIRGALQRLTDSGTIDLKEILYTDTLRITVYLPDPQAAAQRANYLATRLEQEPPSRLSIQVLQHASPPRWPSKPSLVVIAPITCALGILIAIAGAKALSINTHRGLLDRLT